MNYSNISLNNIYLILSFIKKYKTTFKDLISFIIDCFISLYYLLINFIIYLIKKNLLQFKKKHLNPISCQT